MTHEKSIAPAPRDGWLPIVRWTFEGQRFRGSGLDLRDVHTMYAYRNIVTSFARAIWRRDNSERARAPKDFGSKVHLKFFTIVNKCAQIDIYRKARPTQTTLLKGPQPANAKDITGKLPEATDMFSIILDELSHGTVPRFDIPRNALLQFKHIGESLRSSEHVDINLFEPDPDSNIVRIDDFVPSIRVDRRYWRSVNETIKEMSLLFDGFENITTVEFKGKATGIVSSNDAQGPVMLDISGRGRLNRATNKVSSLSNVAVVPIADVSNDRLLQTAYRDATVGHMGSPIDLNTFKSELEADGGLLSQMDEESANAMREIIRLAMDDVRPAGQALVDELESLIASVDATSLKKDIGES